MTQKRRYTRFNPDNTTLAFIDLNPKTKSFKPNLTALVLQESHGGCCIAVSKTNDLTEGSEIKIKVGNVAPLNAQIRWIKKMDPLVYSVGIMFVE